MGFAYYTSMQYLRYCCWLSIYAHCTYSELRGSAREKHIGRYENQAEIHSQGNATRSVTALHRNDTVGL